MMGYIHADNPGVIVPTSAEKLGDGWYDTGDIVNIDDEGYVTILGREKRFAKIAGEMVSLPAVEELVGEVDKEGVHCAVCVEDDKKGEKIILFTTNKSLNREMLAEQVRKTKSSELYIPRQIVPVEEIPVLATGKVNYREMIEMAKKLQ